LSILAANPPKTLKLSYYSIAVLCKKGQGVFWTVKNAYGC
jgi:hypothetical protein